MPFLEWTEKNKTNVKTCDDQHKKLFQLVNTLYDAMKEGKGNDVMKKILDELVGYTAYHFSTEENLMQKYNYPGLVWHKKEHEDLAKKAKELKEKSDKGEFIISSEVLSFLKNWLNTHTMGSDRKYGEFLNNKGIF
ncbi:MAG: bacteriohemerythrin [Deltaproteobacteria bacterium]|nr:bacteriohemerythrin [Deltaproteobacteria bacterium]